MDAHDAVRRDVLKRMTTLTAAVVTGVRRCSRDRPGPGEVSDEDVVRSGREVRDQGERGGVPRTPGGRQLMARIYQPQGPGPFPMVLDLHGGAWNAQGPPRRGADGPRDRGERRAGGGDRHDARAGGAVPGVGAGRELRRALAEVEGAPNGTAIRRRLGVYGSSSGGHVAELLAMRPRDPRYNAIPLPDGAEARRDGAPTSRRARRSATRTRASSRPRR